MHILINFFNIFDRIYLPIDKGSISCLEPSKTVRERETILASTETRDRIVFVCIVERGDLSHRQSATLDNQNNYSTCSDEQYTLSSRSNRTIPYISCTVSDYSQSFFGSVLNTLGNFYSLKYHILDLKGVIGLFQELKDFLITWF